MFRREECAAIDMFTGKVYVKIDEGVLRHPLKYLGLYV